MANTGLNIPENKTELKHFIKGAWTSGTGETIEVDTPYNGSIIGVGKEIDLKSLNEAIEFSVSAQKDWAAKPLKERTRVMFNLREFLIEKLDEISHLKSAESGKVFNEGKAGLLKGIEVLEYALSLQNADDAGKMEVSRGVTCEYRRLPLGVVAMITPFNFPAMVPMWTLPISMTLGNAVFWKPSEKTPLTAMKICEAFEQAGLPKGILNLVHGRAGTVEALLDHKDIEAASFVGSTAIAKKVYERGTQNHKRVLALGGAKNHIVLLPDASLEMTGKGISDSFTGCAGQRCMAASVLLAVGDVEGHIEKIKERASSLSLGTDMGAIITSQQKAFLEESIAKAESEGATILLDGRDAKAPAGMEGGNWLGPTILDNVKPGSHAATVELFGPVLSIIRCKDISEAMTIQNSSPYGNACSVFTSSGPLAEKVISMAQAGMVGVNVGVPVPREPFSFGGSKESKFGAGDITGEHSLDFWSQMKKVTVKWEAQSDNNWMS
jgi:malonate-semialdehyde dehydrogenase (acetylating)/methylmalonate-semialdehyde dehydrogenase